MVCLLAWSCSKKEKQVVHQEEIPAVTVEVVHQREVPQQSTYTATVEG